MPLPPDAPPGHLAHQRVRFDRSTERAAFSYHGIHFQTTTHKSGSQEAAEVLARACWMEFEKGKVKADVLLFRDEWYERLGSEGSPVSSGSSNKKTQDPKSHRSLQRKGPGLLHGPSITTTESSRRSKR
ncbi:unnamed protein product [Cladocopium goreaui]|uniref:3'-5' exonuclease domain-containing protein n=1 Tax=Cladocopium goreaui TaxID=2562237 RepID=A0A9P1FMR8_9DINO|nr:unnamed protein product [Cladocopium goreaui]